MDETALVILLVDLARREGALDSAGVARFWPMVRKAAGFIVANGPMTKEDRWEEQPGYSVSTIAVEVGSLLAAADLAELHGEPETAAYLRQTADAWNESLDTWLYATGTELARSVGVDGYYIRVAPLPQNPADSPIDGQIPLRNREPRKSMPAVDMVGPDALMLVRFGLRSPDDPRILSTVRVIDALLKLDTAYGPVWHRYNEDGYGEHVDGSPFDGTGVGRAWPLLTGERGHYELAAGHADEAQRMLQAMESFANEGGMIPEQVWDADDIPGCGLFFGHPTGSANPLVWAHAEYVKLRRSLLEGRVFDMPPQTVQRYLAEHRPAEFATWRFNAQPRTVPAGKKLRLEVLAPAMVHWGVDAWHHIQDVRTRPTALGIHVADLPTERLAHGRIVNFTFYWLSANRWEGTDFSVTFREREDGRKKPAAPSEDAMAPLPALSVAKGRS